MMCGPDLVDDVTAQLYRAPGEKVTENEQSGFVGTCNGAQQDDPDIY